MSDHAPETEDEYPAEEEGDDSTSDQTDEARRQDPDAPGLGAVDGGEELPDLPEPQEPG
jgi:hypothetical protein